METQDYESFLDEVSGAALKEQSSALAALYHHVRRIPYGAAGQRDPRLVHERNVGSCSGKHILLRDLLRRNGFQAGVVTIFTHFNKGVPDRAEFGPELRRMVREESVCDFHHYVRVEGGDGPLALDATWHDALEPFGFPVNSRWTGHGDTEIAAETIREFDPVEDVPELKQRLLANLTEEERATRQHFFDLLTAWIGALGGARR